ncbi:MAG: GNAT family N-acetyltransferase [Azospirillaceae bacterium]
MTEPGTRPTLTTPRLSLAPHTLADYEDSCRLWGDAEVVRYISGTPSTRSEVWQRLLRYAGHWELLGYGFFVLREAATGRFVGEVGLADFHRDIEPPLTAPEAGWVLVPEMQGRGYATEALAAVLAWGERARGMTRFQAIVDERHAASIAVAARCGFTESHRADFHGDAVVVLDRAAGA